MPKAIHTLLFLLSISSVNAQHPSIGGYNVYYGHLHNHSTVSDGTGTDDDAYNYARNVAGLDYFSTANHVGSIAPSEWVLIRDAAEKYNEDGVFAAFWGFEWSNNGHVAVIGTEDYPGISADPSGSFTELCTWLDARNGIAFFNHPGRGTSMLYDGFATTPSDRFVGMELFNSTADYSMHYYNDGFYPNDGNLNHYAEALSRGWRIGASGSDDNHAGTWGTRTDWRMAILAEQLSRSGLLAAMQARRFYSTLDKNLALFLSIDTCEMGSSIEGGDYDLRILASDLDEEAFTRIMLFRDGLEMQTWEIDTSEVSITLPVQVSDNEFYHVKVTQADGDEAVSSPVFIGAPFKIRPLCSLTYPDKAIHLTDPQLITLTAEASDADGTVASVEFFVNDSSLGSDTLPPYSVNYTIPSIGAYTFTAIATDNSGAWTASSRRIITVGHFSQTRIMSGMDDVEEDAAGGMYTNSSDIELVYAGGNQVIGLRFTGTNIPPVAKIESAYIQFTVDEASTGTCVLSIRGHDADDSPPFTSASWAVSGRATTSAGVAWQPPDWPTIGAAGPDQRTPDLSSIVQQIVNRPGYAQGNAISFIITGTGERTAESYEGSSGSSAQLTVTYTPRMASSESIPAPDETLVRIYPNPVSGGRVTVEVDGGIEIGTRLTITDIAGRIHHQSRIEHRNTNLDVSGLKSGIYIITLTSDHRVASRRLIVK